MSIEELVIQIQNGDTRLKNELWERVFRWVYVLCKRYLPYTRNKGYEWGDLISLAWFGVEYAIKAYDPEKGFMFLSYLKYSVRNFILKGLGVGSKRRLTTVSADKSIGGEEEEKSLLDLIEDEKASESFDEVERNIALPVVWEFVDKLEYKQAVVVKEIFLKGKTLSEIGKEWNVCTSYVGYIKRQALQRLKTMRELKEFYYDLSYKCVDLNTFARTRTSSTEIATMKQLELEEKIYS